MFDVFTHFATDEVKENQGADFPLGDATLVIARSGNRAYAKALTQAIEANREVLDAGGDAADKISDKIMIDVLTSSVLLGWKNLGFKGAELPYTPENAAMLLGVRDFRNKVKQLSENADAYRAKLEAEQGKA